MVLCALRRVLARHFNTRSWLQACWQSWEHAAVSAGWCGESSAVAQVVITGSSKGLGYAMAQQFLALGDDVVINSRSSEDLVRAADSLRLRHPERRVLPYEGDVRDAGEL